MRISTNENDPGYALWKKFRYEKDIKTFFDGKEIFMVETADEELGLVIVAVEDKDGGIIVDDNDQIKTKELHGVVKIELVQRSEERITHMKKLLVLYDNVGGFAGVR